MIIEIIKKVKRNFLSNSSWYEYSSSVKEAFLYKVDEIYNVRKGEIEKIILKQNSEVDSIVNIINRLTDCKEQSKMIRLELK